ncbi:hypothetical protein ACIBAC_29095 [Streptomyces sp. NPDC051362]|uniref:hypothetical protein n=1 Tax=Streptomyces sp. NPDC051362 TaxID=3365651 RepID=UPI003789FCB7
MTAIEETAAAEAEKSTCDPIRAAGRATQALTLPQLPYADAVVAELDAACMPPVAVEVGLRDTKPSHPELFMRFVWPVGSNLLDEGVQNRGLTIAWSHVTGWSAHPADEAPELLNVDALADPRAIAYAALELAEQPLTGTWTPPTELLAGRWSSSVYLDIALIHFEGREQR